jgi:hypothetical protein
LIFNFPLDRKKNILPPFASSNFVNSIPAI